MIPHFLLLVLISHLTSGLPLQERSKNVVAEPKQFVYIVEGTQNTQPTSQETQSLKQQPLASQRQLQQSIPAELSSYGLSYYDPQIQYPGFNFLQDKQLFPRVQPQIVLYGPGGQGQPILINPGSPPGNFLVPHHPTQPGPNFIFRDSPQRPVFVAGYPKPAHIPPIEKDAEEIPTNPAKIPPLPSVSARKPEKLETFNEGKDDYPTKFAGEADVLAAADRIPQIPGFTLKPGQRFFILNGANLFTNFPLENSLKFSQPQLTQSALPESRQQQFLDKQEELDFNAIPIQSALLRDSGANQLSSVQDLSSDEKLPQNLFALNQPLVSQEPLFKSSLPLNVAGENVEPLGQFRYIAPNGPYFPFEDDIENDAIVVDAKVENAESSNSDSGSEANSESQKSPEPSTAQAAPGAIAIAGPGGVAGAAPRGTALVGKGGLAISSPQATAVAGTKKTEQKDKTSTKKSN